MVNMQETSNTDAREAHLIVVAVVVMVRESRHTTSDTVPLPTNIGLSRMSKS